MLFVIGIQVIQRKPVVAGQEVDRGVFTLLGRIQVGRAADALHSSLCQPVVALEEAAQVVAVLAVPLRPAVP